MPGMDDYQLKYDEQGRPYYQLPGQPRNYVSPVAMGGKPPEDDTSIFRSRPQWDQDSGKWETPIDWGNIMNIGVGAGLGAGFTNALGLWGAGGAGPYIPGGEAALPGALAAENAGGIMAPGLGAAAGAAGAAKNLFGIPNWLRDALGLGIAGASAIKGFSGGNNAGQKGLEDILGIARGRVEASEPLFKALTAMAQSQLPDYAKSAGGFGAPSGAVPRPPGQEPGGAVPRLRWPPDSQGVYLPGEPA